MKEYKYTVTYLNGNVETFYAFSFARAMILAMAYAIGKGLDMRVKYIYNEDLGKDMPNDMKIVIELHNENIQQ